MKVVSVINYKGGVGKTTVTANLGAQLANRGYRVLLIDLDPQASLTFSFFSAPEWTRDIADRKTIKRWFDEFTASQGDTGLPDLIVTPPEVNAHLADPDGRLDLIASHLGLINVDLNLASKLIGIGPKESKARFLEVHGRLAHGLSPALRSGYEFVLIDCPPNFNIVTKTAIVASSHLLVPSRADHLSTLGIQYLLESVDELVGEYNEYVNMPPYRKPEISEIHPTVLGVIFTMIQLYAGKPIRANQEYITRTSLAQNVPTFTTSVRSNQRLYSEATANGIPVAIASNTHDNISRELNRLTDEFLRRLEIGEDAQ